jgi:hypothetical protein
MSRSRVSGFSLTASVSGRLDCTVGVQEEQTSLHAQTEKANLTSAESFLFLKNFVFLPQYIMFILINASSDTHLHTLYAIAHLWLHTTLQFCISDNVTVHFEYFVKKNIFVLPAVSNMQ